ncbi:glycoside hydrolase family 88 protein [Pontibacter qinzhouensis]|uniref:Glycoside hydrolase family 88 protein n=1 Tax=Pontibacter qinzhouensis TaxID=2603253 RepID=A0A5C8KCQ7_9BACT|nr:glycoside hydrolase family 88 protein [Pontibacter qinzhouensis]TXK49134.1 glycoside hydrolase family 88 protein [Pontibacter qinzhouensis]
MKLRHVALSVLVLMAAACNTSNPTAKSTAVNQQDLEKPWSVQMADSEIKRTPKGWMIDFAPKPKWDYTQGLFASSIDRVYKRTGDEKYLNYIKAFADTMISESGTIMTYKKTDYNIDRVNPGKFLIELHKETGIEKYKLAVEELRDQMRTHPRTAEGGFWHKKIYPHQMWLDGLYMGSPFLAQYAKEFNEPALFDDVANQIYLVDKYTWNEEKRLFHHAWDEKKEQKWADPVTGRAPEVWGRAMGWFAMSLVDVLDFMPKDHPKRADIIRVTKKMAGAIKQYQDPATGLWWQVVDQGGREGNYLEGSASTMFTYFLVKAVKNNYIEQEYLQTAQKGFDGITRDLIRKEADGTISLIDICAVAGLGGTPYRDGTYEYYISEPRRANDPKGVAPFIMAALEFEELQKTTSR